MELDAKTLGKGGSCLPNFLIIGARKAGTTSLHHYLSAHPQIFMSREKELSFFDPQIRWKLGVDWYKSNFNSAYPLNGEASPQYSRYPRVSGVPERIRQVLGTPKLIYIIRDPIDQILSAYVHTLGWKPMTTTFEGILPNIESDPEEYLQGSSYFLQISQYLKFFPSENLLVVLQERLNSNPRAEITRIFRFLGVDDSFWSPDFEKRLNTADSKRLEAAWFRSIAPETLRNELRRAAWMPWRLDRLVSRVARIGGPKITKPILTQSQELQLQDLLRKDVTALKDFLNDPLPEWRPYC